MSDMLAFCTGMLGSIADFLVSPPMIYLFGFFALGWALKYFKQMLDF